MKGFSGPKRCRDPVDEAGTGKVFLVADFPPRLQQISPNSPSRVINNTVEKSVLSHRILTLQQDAFYDHADHITLFNTLQVYK